MASITAFIADDEGNGLPNQDVALRRKGLSDFGVDAYQMVDVDGEPGAYKYSGHVTDTYKVWVNGVEDKGYGGDDGVDVIRIADVLLKSGGTMTGILNMGANRIENVGAPINVGDAVNFLTLYTYYLAKAGGTMAGDVSMDGNRINDLPDSPISDNEASPAGWVTETLTAALAAYFKKDGSVAMTGDFNAAGKKITNLPAPAANGEPLRFDEAINFLDKRATASAQIVKSFVNFLNYCPATNKFPTALNNLTNRKFVEDYVTEKFLGIVAGTVPVYQQSLNILRVIPSGTAEDGRVFRTLEAAVTYAAEYATADRIYTILIEGNGVDTSVLANWNLIPVSLPEFINIVGVDRGIKLVAAEDTYELNGNIICNVIIDNENDDADTIFENAVLIDVEFTNADGSPGATYTLTDCKLIGDNTYGSCAVTLSGTTAGCVRNIDSNYKTITYDIVSKGDYVIANQSGDIRGRRQVGRQGTDVASGNDIVLGNGNYHVVTGTTSIEYIRHTDWEDGSVIYLEFQTGLTLINGSPGFDDLAGIITSTGANKAFASGKIGTFILTGDKTFWKEI